MSTSEILHDLQAEQSALDDVMATLSDDAWEAATPSPGWTVADQIGHLTYFDGDAALAIEDVDAFVRSRDALVARAASESGDGGLTLRAYRAMTPSELFGAWRSNRARLAAAGAKLGEGDRVVWYGPSMSGKSFLTARLMECWAHGQDIVDTVGATRPSTDRLRHVAQLGYITRGWSYANRGETPPPGSVRLELVAPSGGVWTWGPDDADDTVRGTAFDFCLVVTQRRHLADTGLSCGELGSHWLQRAQAFAGEPTDGPYATSD
ncbi:MAG: TIGR03084 family metal-binding protein [Ilumatobacteraceae bacterium]